MPCSLNPDGTLDTSTLTPEEAQTLKAQQIRLSITPYYSAAGFFAHAAAGAYTIKQGTEVKAFGFQLGQDATVAGLSTADLGSVATYTETNLQESGKTISGQAVHVKGIALQPFPDSEPDLLRLLFANLSARISFAGGLTTYELGPLHHLAGASGLFGTGRTSLGQNFDGQPFAVSNQTNGFPGVDNYMPVREGFTWWDQGADSQMNLILRVNRDIVIAQPAAVPAVAGNQANLYPIVGFTPPEVIKAIFSIKLVGEITAPRSMIS